MKSIKSQTYIFTGTLFLIIIVLLGFAVKSALKERMFVQEYEIRNALTSQLNLAAQFQAVERGLGAIIIASGDKETSKLQKAFIEAANKGDDHARLSLFFVEGLAALKRDRALTEHINNWQNGFEKLKNIRQEFIKHNVTKEEWISATSKNINNGFKLRDYTFIPDDKKDYEESELVYLRSILQTNIATLAEYAGRERALVANTLAKNVAFSPDTLNEIKQYRSIVDHSIEKIMFLKDHASTTKEIKGAIEEFEKEFLGNYQKLRGELYSSSAIHEQSIKENSLKVFNIRKILEYFFQVTTAEIFNINTLKSVKELAKAFISGEQKDLPKKISRVANEFKAFAQVIKMFDQIRLLDPAGKERVRVNSKHNDAIIVSDNELQDKSSRYYFREAMLLEDGDMYVSPLDLNKEHGGIESPFKTVIRYALPVYVDGDIGGIVAMNIRINTDSLLNAPWDEGMIDSDDDMMVDQNGYYLHHSDRSKEWGFMAELGRSAENIKNDFSGDVDNILSGKDETIQFSSANSVIYTPFFYNPKDKENFWVIIQPVINLNYPLSAEAWFEISTKAINKAIAISIAANKKAHNEIANMVSSSRIKLIVSAVFLFFAVTIFSLFLIFLKKYLLRPVEELINFTKRVGKGDFSHIVEIKTGNEIEELGRSFNTMTQELEESRKNLLDHENHMQESEERLLTIIESSSDALITMNQKGLITMFNSAAEKMFGLKSEEMIGKTLEPLMPEEFREQHIRGVENFFSTGKPRSAMGKSIEIRGLRSNGKTFPIALTLTYGGQGEKMFVLGNIRDITERKAAENEIIQHRNNLQMMVEQQTIELIGAVKKARSANQAKSDFLANMSHELRTPMNGILALSTIGEKKSENISVAKVDEFLDELQKDDQSLEDVFLNIAEKSGVNNAGLAKEAANELGLVIKKKKFFSKEVNEFFTIIRSSGDLLLGLINNLLDLSKLDADKMDYDFEELNLLEVAQTVVREVEVLARERCLNINIDKTDVDTTACFDKSKIKQVIRNFLSNAIKFAGKNTVICLSFADGSLPIGHRKSDTKVVPALSMAVRDRGIGIPEEELKDIFNPFIQSSKTKTKAGGTGLGLSISKKIIEAHGGEIWAENHPDGGAIFTVVLPKAG